MDPEGFGFWKRQTLEKVRLTWGGPLCLENPETLRFLVPLKPFGPQDPLTLEPWDPGTLDIIDTLLPTTPTKHLTAWRSGDGGEGAVRVDLAVCGAPGGCARAAGIRVIGVWEAAHH